MAAGEWEAVIRVTSPHSTTLGVGLCLTYSMLELCCFNDPKILICVDLSRVMYLGSSFTIELKREMAGARGYRDTKQDGSSQAGRFISGG